MTDEHRCIVGTVFVLNDEEGPAFIKVPYRIGDPSVDGIDWVLAFNYCPDCGKKISEPIGAENSIVHQIHAKTWMDRYWKFYDESKENE